MIGCGTIAAAYRRSKTVIREGCPFPPHSVALDGVSIHDHAGYGRDSGNKGDPNESIAAGVLAGLMRGPWERARDQVI